MSTRALLAFSLTALAGMTGLSAGEAALKSGLQPGDKTSPFQTRDITGPSKGKSLCYV